MPDSVVVVLTFHTKNGAFFPRHLSADLDILFYYNRDILAGNTDSLLQ